MENHIEGTLKKKFDITTHGASFRKMEFIIKTDDDKYPQTIKMQAVSYTHLTLPTICSV